MAGVPNYFPLSFCKKEGFITFFEMLRRFFRLLNGRNDFAVGEASLDGVAALELACLSDELPVCV